MVPNQQAHGIDRLAATAMQFQAAIGPIREALLAAEGRRVHRSRLSRERIKNNGT
jgi:hypothetical protein